MKETIVLICNSHNSDILKFISLYTNKFDVVVISDKYDKELVIDNEVKYLKYNSDLSNYYIYTAKYIIDNCELKTNTKVFNSQKRIGILDEVFYNKITNELKITSSTKVLNYLSNYDLIISPTKEYSNDFLMNTMLYSGEVLTLNSNSTSDYLNEENISKIADYIKLEDKVIKQEEVIFLVNEVHNMGGITNYVQNMALYFKQKYNCKIIVIGEKEYKHTYDDVFFLDETNVDIVLSGEYNNKEIQSILKNTNGYIISTQFGAHNYFQKYLENKKNVLMFHGDVKTMIDKSQYEWQFNMLKNRKLYNYKMFLLCGVDSQRELIKNNISEVPHSRIDNILNPYKFEYKNLYKKSNTFVAVTRLSEDKNVFEYLKIFANKNLNKKFKLEIYGDGPLKSEMQEKIKELKLEKRVLLKGYCEDKDTIFKDKQGMIFTPISEAIPYSILESYDKVIPVYCYDSLSAKDEMINDKTGALIEYENIDMFVEVLNEEKEFDIKDFKEITTNFEVDKILNKWEELFNKLDDFDSIKKGPKTIKLSYVFKKIGNIFNNKIYKRIGIRRTILLEKIKQSITKYYYVFKYKISNKIVKELPTISIIMPYYNNESTINRAIKSIYKQKYNNIEIIIINNNTNFDDTLLDKYSKVKYKKLNKNFGGGGARNEGLKLATGKYVTYLDSDDTLTPGALFFLLDGALKYDVDVVLSKKVRMQEDKNFKSDGWMFHMFSKNYVNEKSDRYLLARETTSTSILYNRQKLVDSKIKFQTIKYEDKIYMAEIFNYFDKIGVINKITYNWHIYGNNTSVTTTTDITNFKDRVKTIDEVMSIVNNRFKLFYFIHIICNDMSVYINRFNDFSDEEQKLIFKEYKRLVSSNIKYYNKNTIDTQTNIELINSVINNDSKRFIKIATMHSNEMN